MTDTVIEKSVLRGANIVQLNSRIAVPSGGGDATWTAEGGGISGRPEQFDFVTLPPRRSFRSDFSLKIIENDLKRLDLAKVRA